MKNSLPVFALIVTACAATLAHGAPAETAAASAESPGLLKKIFGSRQGQRVTFAPAAKPAPEAAPQAAPKAAPAAPKAPKAPAAKPTGKPKKKAAAKVKATDDGDAAPAAKPGKKGTKPAGKPAAAPAAPAAEPDASATPAPAPDVVAPPPAAPPTGKKTRKGKVPAIAAAPSVGGAAPGAGDAEAKEQARFDEVKAKAAADPEVVELKTKADAAVFDEEGKNAQRAYNKALFHQMRKLDGGLEERVNAMEAAILKRLDEK